MEEFFTSESVSEGHPDKLADQISDSILDACLDKDKESRVACEVFLSKGLVFVSGEITTKSKFEVVDIVRGVIEKVGYDSVKKGLDFNSCAILPCFNTQSPNIKNAIGQGRNQGAGDQGFVFGYATDETEELMPLSLTLSHKLMENLANLRKQGHSFLWPDAKAQVTVAYKNGVVDHCSHIVISTQHDPDYELKKLEDFVRTELVKNTIPEKYIRDNTSILVNPGGSFVVGGPQADCGLTGRKIIVDTYGGHSPHGGGAFSGKDPSKVDRSGAYAARHIAKNLVLADLVKKCSVQLAYVIGKADPISICLDTYGTATQKKSELRDIIMKNWNLKPNGIIQDFDLLNVKYAPTATYGHFGRKNLPWEEGNKADVLKKSVNPAKTS